MKHLIIIILLLGFSSLTYGQANITEQTLNLPAPCALLSIDYINAKGLNFFVYPNPATDLLNVNIKASEPLQNPVLTLISVNGQVIYSKKLENNAVIINEQVELRNLSKGIYLLNIESTSYKATKKIIIK